MPRDDLTPALRDRLAGVRAISFDGDGTLWDFEAGMLHGLGRVLAALRQRHPGAAVGALTVADLRNLRDSAERDMPGATMEAIRLEGMRRAVSAAGGQREDLAAATALFDLYYEARYAALVLYPDTRPALEALAARYPLAIVSNGNTDALRAGLTMPFSALLYAAEVGIAKPDPRILHMACERIGCAPAELLHVGDDLEADVAAAQAAGTLSAWLNRAGPRAPGTTRWLSHAQPDLTIASLAELPALLFASSQR